MFHLNEENKVRRANEQPFGADWLQKKREKLRMFVVLRSTHKCHIICTTILRFSSHVTSTRNAFKYNRKTWNEAVIVGRFALDLLCFLYYFFTTLPLLVALRKCVLATAAKMLNNRVPVVASHVTSEEFIELPNAYSTCENDMKSSYQKWRMLNICWNIWVPFDESTQLRGIYFFAYTHTHAPIFFRQFLIN